MRIYKLSKSFLLILISFSMMFAFVLGINTSANSIDGNRYITNSSITNTTNPGSDSFGLYDTLQANWTFHIPKSSPINAGDVMDIPIPNQLMAISSINFDVKDNSGNIVASAQVDKDNNKLTLTYTTLGANLIKNSDIDGKIGLSLNWNLNTIQPGKTNIINWGLNSQVSNVYINSDGVPSAQEHVFKWGWYDDTNPHIIHWRIRVNYGKTSINNAVLTDSLGPNEKLISGSITAKSVTYSTDGSSFVSGNSVPTSNIIEDSNTDFHINFGDINSTYIVDYEAQITDNISSEHYSNFTELNGTNFTDSKTAFSPELTGGGSVDYLSKINISGAKTWNDNNNQDGIRPNSITVHLLANGKIVQSIQVTAASDWKYHFTDVPKFDNGQLIYYSISEDPVDGYSSSVDGDNITNSHTSGVPTNRNNTGKSENNTSKSESESNKSIALPLTGKTIKNHYLDLIEIAIIFSTSYLFALLKTNK